MRCVGSIATEHICCCARRGRPVCNFAEPNLTTYIAAPSCIVNPHEHARAGQAHIRNGGHTHVWLYLLN